MSFADRFNQQRRDAERAQKQQDEDVRRSNAESDRSIEREFDGWYKNSLTPVWNIWNRLNLEAKIRATSSVYPTRRFSFGIQGVRLVKNRYDFRSEGRGFSWSESSGSATKTQDNSFVRGDFEYRNMLVCPRADATTSLSIRAEGEDKLVANSRYQNYFSVSVTNSGIYVTGLNGKLDLGVSGKVLDDAMLYAIEHPDVDRTRDPS